MSIVSTDSALHRTLNDIIQCYSSCHINADINECSSNPCQNGGSCQNNYLEYECDCLPAYTGYNCERCTCDKELFDEFTLELLILATLALVKS